MDIGFDRCWYEALGVEIVYEVCLGLAGFFTLTIAKWNCSA